MARCPPPTPRAIPLLRASWSSLEAIAEKKYANLQIEILRKILADQIRTSGRRNATRGRLLSAELAAAVLRCQNRALTDAEIVVELANLAREVRGESERHREAGLWEAEMAFHDAVIQNDSAVLELGD